MNENEYDEEDRPAADTKVEWGDDSQSFHVSFACLSPGFTHYSQLVHILFAFDSRVISIW